jgi:hypothetical protein
MNVRVKNIMEKDKENGGRWKKGEGGAIKTGS